MQTIITKNFRETQKLGKKIAREVLLIDSRKTHFRGLSLSKAVWPLIICLSGNLGSGKTTFAQGLLKELKIKGPHASPTFVIIKHYRRKIPISKSESKSKLKNEERKIQNIYHIDAYRVSVSDLLNLGWREIISNKHNIVIVEWADRIKRIIPKKSLWINFKWIDNNSRKIIIDKK